MHGLYSWMKFFSSVIWLTFGGNNIPRFQAIYLILYFRIIFLVSHTGTQDSRHKVINLNKYAHTEYFKAKTDNICGKFGIPFEKQNLWQYMDWTQTRKLLLCLCNPIYMWPEKGKHHSIKCKVYISLKYQIPFLIKIKCQTS